MITTKLRTFEDTVKEIKTHSHINTMQVNITRKCNLACRHCHVESSPSRLEDMDMETAKRVLEVFEEHGFKILDLTGGAPELSNVFKYLVEEGSKIAEKVIVRTNLTVHAEGDDKDLEFFKDNDVSLVASLPSYDAKKTDSQRGRGVFEDSINVLQRLNGLGYGRELELNLVYNPNGAILPGNQIELESVYRRKLMDEHMVEFTNLLALANNPSGRFKDWLERSGNYEMYMEKLIDAFNPATVENVMCRDMISVDYDGSIYDCDFNLAIDLKANMTEPTIFSDMEDLYSRDIALGEHCYGCTAGAGSSCGGSVELN